MTLPNKYTTQIEINQQVNLPSALSLQEALQSCTQKALECCNLPRNCVYNVSVLLCEDNAMAKLNLQFRGKNCTTNVLSFADGELTQNTKYLGDIAISIPKIMQEAKEQDKTFKTHFLHMYVHGVLHLLGYTHEQPHKQKQMEELEDKILNACVL